MARAKQRSTEDSEGEEAQIDAPAPRDELAETRKQLAELQSRLSSTEGQLSEERAHRSAAEVRSMTEAERRLRAELNSSDTALASMESEATSIEDQIATLSDEPGHGKEIAVLTRKLTTLSARTESETARKAWLAGEIERAKAAPERTPAPAGEVLASGIKLSEMTPKVQTWFKAHPRSFTDRAYLDRVIAAANYAANVEGIPVESDEYFAFVDSKLDGGSTQARAPQPRPELDEGEDLVPDRPNADSPYSAASRPAARGELDYRVEQPQSRAAGPGAIAAATPPSRSVPAGAGGNRREPLLSPEQREVADSLYGHVKDAKERYLKYAENNKFMAARKGAGLSMN